MSSTPDEGMACACSPATGGDGMTTEEAAIWGHCWSKSCTSSCAAPTTTVAACTAAVGSDSSPSLSPRGWARLLSMNNDVCTRRSRRVAESAADGGVVDVSERLPTICRRARLAEEAMPPTERPGGWWATICPPSPYP